MRPGRAADHSPSSSAAVMEEQSYTSTHPLGHTGPVTGSLYLLHHLSISGIMFLFWGDSPQWAMTASFTRFLDHTQRHTTVGRTPLDE